MLRFFWLVIVFSSSHFSWANECGYESNKIIPKVEEKRAEADQERQENLQIMREAEKNQFYDSTIAMVENIEMRRSCQADSAKIEAHFESKCQFESTVSACQALKEASDNAEKLLGKVATPIVPESSEGACPSVKTAAQKISEFRKEAYNYLQKLKSHGLKLQELGVACGSAVDTHFNNGQCTSAMDEANIDEFITKSDAKHGCYPEEVDQIRIAVADIMNQKSALVCKIKTDFHRSKVAARALATEIELYVTKVKEADKNIRSMASTYERSCVVQNQ